MRRPGMLRKADLGDMPSPNIRGLILRICSWSFGRVVNVRRNGSRFLRGKLLKRLTGHFPRDSTAENELGNLRGRALSDAYCGWDVLAQASFFQLYEVAGWLKGLRITYLRFSLQLFPGIGCEIPGQRGHI